MRDLRQHQITEVKIFIEATESSWKNQESIIRTITLVTFALAKQFSSFTREKEYFWVKQCTSLNPLELIKIKANVGTT